MNNLSKYNLRELISGELPELGKMIDATPSCLKILTRDGQLLNMNPQGIKLIEATDLNSVFGANVYDLVEQSHREKYIKFNEFICSGESGHLIFEIIGLNGTRRWMETYAAPYTLLNGDLAQIAITNDITNRVLNDQTVIKQKVALEESSRLATLGLFVSGIAHEINNPMSIIQGKAKLLAKRIKADKYDKGYFEDSIEKINTTVSRVTAIINGLKTFSRDPSQVKKREHNLFTIVNDTIDLCREKLRLNEIGISVNVAKEISLECNNIQISQVIMSFINNSFDAIINTKMKWITIDAELSNEWVSIIITDSGLGIEDNVASNMLKPFYTTKEVGQGTGLGLSISKAIIIEHGGSIEYCTKNINTQFIIKIPTTQKKEV
jgi:C4-dicarboxylate-specific signal transduction histidine kinase